MCSLSLERFVTFTSLCVETPGSLAVAIPSVSLPLFLQQVPTKRIISPYELTVKFQPRKEIKSQFPENYNLYKFGMYLFVCVFLFQFIEYSLLFLLKNCQFLLAIGHFFTFEVTDFYDKTLTLAKAVCYKKYVYIRSTRAVMKSHICLPLKMKGFTVFLEK